MTRAILTVQKQVSSHRTQNYRDHPLSFLSGLAVPSPLVEAAGQPLPGLTLVAPSTLVPLAESGL